MNRITPPFIDKLADNEVFVFGSNLAGRHGKGAAKMANKYFGAIYGQAEGLQGKSYAIPFKDGRRKEDPFVKITLPLDEIRKYVYNFTLFAKSNPQLKFLVIEVGCLLAGYAPKDVAPLFDDASLLENVSLPVSFWKVLEQLKTQK